MKISLSDGTWFALLALVITLEGTVWYGCYLDVETSLYKNRHIAIRSPCNEEAELYSEHLNCAEIKRSNQPGLSWLRSTQCLVSKHNIFAMLGWFQITAVLALGVVLAALYFRYQVQMAKRRKREEVKLLVDSHREQYGSRYQTWPVRAGPLIEPLDN